MQIKMILQSDTIFGNGQSIPGAEDLSVLTDEYGFVYYKGSSLKGMFRIGLENLLSWKGGSDTEIQKEITRLLGIGDSKGQGEEKLTFSDFCLAKGVRELVLEEYESVEQINKSEILESQTYLRTMTAIGEDGIVKEGSLRMIRCVKQGLVFYGEIGCQEKDKALVLETLQCIKEIGTLRNRGFGQVKFEEVK